jgi:hypothetical protein
VIETHRQKRVEIIPPYMGKGSASKCRIAADMLSSILLPMRIRLENSREPVSSAVQRGHEAG